RPHLRVRTDGGAAPRPAGGLAACRDDVLRRVDPRSRQRTGRPCRPPDVADRATPDRSAHQRCETGGTMTAQTVMTLLADTALRGGLAIACAGGIAWLLRERPAAARAGVWRAGLLVLLLLPLAGAILPRWSIPILASAEFVQAPAGPTAQESPADASIALPAPALPPKASPVAILFAVWLAGALVTGARLVASHAS